MRDLGKARKLEYNRLIALVYIKIRNLVLGYASLENSVLQHSTKSLSVDFSRDHEVEKF